MAGMLADGKVDRMVVLWVVAMVAQMAVYWEHYSAASMAVCLDMQMTGMMVARKANLTAASLADCLVAQWDKRTEHWKGTVMVGQLVETLAMSTAKTLVVQMGEQLGTTMAKMSGRKQDETMVSTMDFCLEPLLVIHWVRPSVKKTAAWSVQSMVSTKVQWKARKMIQMLVDWMVMSMVY